MTNLNQTIKYGVDFVLVSDDRIARPEGLHFVCTCPAGSYYARDGVTKEMITAAVKASK